MSQAIDHAAAPLDARVVTDSIGARVVRIRRYLASGNLTLPMRRSAKDELKLLIAEARGLWEVL